MICYQIKFFKYYTSKFKFLHKLLPVMRCHKSFEENLYNLIILYKLLFKCNQTIKHNPKLVVIYKMSLNMIQNQ